MYLLFNIVANVLQERIKDVKNEFAVVFSSGLGLLPPTGTIYKTYYTN